MKERNKTKQNKSDYSLIQHPVNGISHFGCMRTHTLVNRDRDVFNPYTEMCREGQA